MQYPNTCHRGSLPAAFLLLFSPPEKSKTPLPSFLKKIFVTILKVSHSGSAYLPTAARRRADEEHPYLFLLNITPSTATQQLTAYNGAEKQYSTPLRLFSPPPADDKPLLLRKKMHKTNFMQNIQYKTGVYA